LQCSSFEQFEDMMTAMRMVAAAVGRTIDA